MKLARILVFLALFVYISGCEPIRYTHDIKSIDMEPPKETVAFKKIPYEAIFIVDDTKKYTATHADYSAGVIHDFIFPAGNFIKQALPIIAPAFEKFKVEQSLSSIPNRNSLVIYADVNYMNVKLDCCLPLVFDAKTTLRFLVYDNDLIPICLPIYAEGKASMSKPGLFAIMDDKEYAQVAYQSITEATKNAIDGIYEAVNNPKKIITETKQEINKNPSNILAYTVVANRALKAGDYAEALAAAQMVIQLNPKDINGYLLLYKIYKAQRKYKDAKAQIEQAVALNPQNAILFTHIYNFYIEEGKLDKAMNAVKRYIEARPDDKYAGVLLGMLYLTMGRYDDAISISQKTIDSLTFYGIGASITKKEDFPVVNSIEPESPAAKAGIKPADEILEIDGASTKELKIDEIIKKLRGSEGTPLTLTIKRKNIEEPMKITLTREKFYSRGGLVADYLAIMTISEIQKGNINKAERLMDEVLKIAKSSYAGIATVRAHASLLIALQEYDKIIKGFSDFDDSYTKLMVATAYAKKGMYINALKIYKNINKKDLLITENTLKKFHEALEPYVQDIEKKTRNYEKEGNLIMALKSYAEMLDMVSEDKASWIRGRVARLIALNPSLVEISGTPRQHILNSEVLFNAGKYEEALQELEKAKIYVPFNPQIYFNSALVCEKMGDYNGAIKNMEIFLQLMPSYPQAQEIKDQIYKWKFILEKEI